MVEFYVDRNKFFWMQMMSNPLLRGLWQATGDSVGALARTQLSLRYRHLYFERLQCNATNLTLVISGNYPVKNPRYEDCIAPATASKNQAWNSWTFVLNWKFQVELMTIGGFLNIGSRCPCYDHHGVGWGWIGSGWCNSSKLRINRWKCL